jgi:hypothetical protein
MLSMSSLRSLVGAGAGSLARRIDRLRNTLHLLSEKLREAVSTAIGQEVADAVRDVVFTMLTGPPAVPDFADRRAPPYHQTRSLWNPFRSQKRTTGKMLGMSARTATGRSRKNGRRTMPPAT